MFQSTPPARAATEASYFWDAWNAFQSTPPARAATRRAMGPNVGFRFQSTPPARAATLPKMYGTPAYRFNPRRPRGRRLCVLFCVLYTAVFQSTPPARAATCLLCRSGTLVYVSIHAAREGGDGTRSGIQLLDFCFNPRRPRGRRPCILRRRCRSPPSRAAWIETPP